MTIEIGQTSKLFNLDEAQEHFPLVQTITSKHQIQLAPIQSRLNLMLSNDPRRAAIEVEYEKVVSMWMHKIQQLGATVQGLWVVEFNVGEGYLCWRYPELSLNYIRLKGQIFSSRIKLANYIEEYDPDWS